MIPLTRSVKLMFRAYVLSGLQLDEFTRLHCRSVGDSFPAAPGGSGGNGGHMGIEELQALAVERRARAERAREVASCLSDVGVRQGVLRYAETLDRDVDGLIVRIVAKKAASFAIDVI